MLKLYQNDVGIDITVATGISLIGATSVALKVKKPSGASATWAATVDGVNVKQLNYATGANDLNEVGRYFIQSYAVVGGKTLYGQTAEIDIYGPYQ